MSALPAVPAAGERGHATPCGPGGSPGQVHIAVLGPLAIIGNAQDLQPKHAELITALAIAGPAGVPGTTLRGMLGADEDHPKPQASLRQIITRARRRLGTAPGGNPYIIHAGGQYILDPAASLDLHAFRSFAAAGRNHRDPRPLRDALSLVRGLPFDGMYYWWLEAALINDICDEITDTASQLSALELAVGNTAAAARAARAGLVVDSASEQLWRALMRAEDAAGNTAGVHQAWRNCLSAIAGIAPDGAPHPATTALYRDLTRRAVNA